VTFGRVGKERLAAAAWGAGFTAILALLIVTGSRNLQHFDAALVRPVCQCGEQRVSVKRTTGEVF